MKLKIVEIVQLSGYRCVSAMRAVIYVSPMYYHCPLPFPENTSRPSNAVLMPDNCLRRWPSIKTALSKCYIFSELLIAFTSAHLPRRSLGGAEIPRMHCYTSCSFTIDHKALYCAGQWVNFRKGAYHARL